MHRRTLLALAAIYAVLLGFVFWGLIETRAWVLQTYGTAEATENWNDFRQALTQGKDPPALGSKENALNGLTFCECPG